jgi:hypothetical protein
MAEYEFTIAVRVLADDEQKARERLDRLIKLGYRIKYVVPMEDEPGEESS